MTDEELDDMERRARVNGNIRPERTLALVAEVRRLRSEIADWERGPVDLPPAPRVWAATSDRPMKRPDLPIGPEAAQ